MGEHVKQTNSPCKQSNLKGKQRTKDNFQNFYQKGILSDSLEGNLHVLRLLLCDGLPIMPWNEFLTTYVDHKILLNYQHLIV